MLEWKFIIVIFLLIIGSQFSLKIVITWYWSMVKMLKKLKLNNFNTFKGKKASLYLHSMHSLFHKNISYLNKKIANSTFQEI